MGVEIERKFCVIGNEWRQTQGVLYRQGYLCRDKERTVRVRVAGDVAYLTIKGITQGASRAEYEYEIPISDAEQLLTMCDGPLVEKIRRVITLGETTWEVDEFLGENAGLVIAEVELQSEDQPFERPSWLGLEVTYDSRYFNSNLLVNPYKYWRESALVQATTFTSITQNRS